MPVWDLPHEIRESFERDMGHSLHHQLWSCGTEIFSRGISLFETTKEKFNPNGFLEKNGHCGSKQCRRG